ncbi:hypothetical protein MNBD_GAMMA11-160 [hydrothermal vent metagenome]|uniref:PEP-CTERM protein-sorting domain-containing protein n=1 Tax=hydrothermal vent metagenome TaxID=652676 RepID=A0A3B0XQ05_9ZZZZ
MFNVAEDSLFDYSWGEAPGLFNSDTASLFLENESGDFILECRTTVLCSQGSSGRVYLAQGEYVLSYAAFSEIFTGTIRGSEISFTFEASPIPVPAAVWLFISGLAGLFFRIR